MTTSAYLRRGDIHLVAFAGGNSEPDGTRPAIIATSNTANISCTSILVIPLTSRIDNPYTFQVIIQNSRSDLDKDSKAQVEMLTCVGVGRIKKKIGRVPDDIMAEVDRIIIEHLGLKKYIG